MRAFIILLLFTIIASAYGRSYIDPCRLPKNAGMCKARLPRWYFDASTNKCKFFYYGGCKGNANNFKTKEDCMQRCPGLSRNPCRPNPCRNGGSCKPSPVDAPICTCPPGYSGDRCQNFNGNVCDLKFAQSGLCKAYMPSWSYNKQSKKCERFIYGGCGGNGNRFSSKAACEKKCDVCQLPLALRPCKPITRTRWYFDASANRCKSTENPGCPLNGNIFDSEEECEERCPGISRNPCKPNPCRNGGTCTSPRDLPVCTCPPNYSGDKCQTFTGDVCSLQFAKNGNNGIVCLAYIPSWSFNQAKNKCEKFIYGGCGGNANRFPSEEECNDACPGGNSGNPCEQPKQPGPCRGSFPRWYYDKGAKKCKKFIYGGCKGNANNFKSKEECEYTCPCSGSGNPCRPNPCLNGGECSIEDGHPVCNCSPGYYGEFCQSCDHEPYPEPEYPYPEPEFPYPEPEVPFPEPELDESHHYHHHEESYEHYEGDKK